MKASVWESFRQKAAKSPCKIALADGEDERILDAAAEAVRRGLCKPVLVGRRSVIEPHWSKRSAQSVEILDLTSASPAERTAYMQSMHSLAKFSSLSEADVATKLSDPLIAGCVALQRGAVDGFIGGATRTTADTVRAVFSVVGLEHGVSTLFGFFLLERQPAPGGLVLLADCAVIPEPTPKQLAQIAIHGAQAFTFFTGEAARVAFLSFSTAGSAQHATVDAVREAVTLARNKAPDLICEGEWQGDAALDPFSARIKGVGSSAMAGRANVLVAPDLNTGNIAYKLIQRVGGSRAVGPVLWGVRRPANDLSRGCSAEDVLDMMALTALQVDGRKTEPTPALAKDGH